MSSPAISIRSAGLRYGERTLFSDLSVDIAPGEFIAVLGPNGSGKTSLIKAILGRTPLTFGSIAVAGRRAATGNPDVGYVPQQRAFAAGALLRGIDLVGLGVDGHRWGIGLPGGSRRRQVADAVAAVGASGFARRPVGTLSGGEQQRLRIAQGIAGNPAVLLCDEPLASLDLGQQHAIANLLAAQRDAGTATVVVTHEINPVLPLVDRIIYLARGRHVVGTPETVLTTAALTELYQADVEVLSIRGRLLVLGSGDSLDSLGPAGAQ